MRNADTILSIIRGRGEKGLPLERVYRLLYTPDLYLRAYARLYSNKGAMTRGATAETVDGMSLAKIEQLIEELRNDKFRWTPVRRVYIPKANGKMRPLGIPTWKDKLLQEVMRSILEAYYEPQFCQGSHGFRPNRGCHTALTDIQIAWKGTRWFIEGDISQYFDTIDHNILLEMLREKIHDGRFLELVRELLRAGYLEDWKYNRTLSGTPQGGVISPILSNIYLDKFDRYVETELVPVYTRGKKRKANPAYNRITHGIADARRGKEGSIKGLRRLQRATPATDTNDPNYRRLRYIRYADDFLLGFTGPKAEAEEIKQNIGAWLKDNLKLTLSDEKTLITHASTQAARFLGYDIVSRHADDWIDTRGRRNLNGHIGLRVPGEVIERKCAQYTRGGVPRERPELLEDSDFSNVVRYQQEYRGVVQYYLLAHNVAHLTRLHWVMETSLLKTLAGKHKTSCAAICKKYKTTTTTEEGQTLTCVEVQVERENKPPLVARFGGISLRRQPLAVLNDTPPVYRSGRTEILKRMQADTCELCGASENNEVHHIRKLADLDKGRGRETPPWMRIMAARRRKTLVVCRDCHVNIHAGRPTRQRVLD